MISAIRSRYCAMHPRNKRDLRDLALYVGIAITIFAIAIGINWRRTARHDQGAELVAFRNFVFRICGPAAPIYLDLPGMGQKIRELITLYLSDRTLKSDWRDDGYFADTITNQVDLLARGDCLIEPSISAIKQPGYTIGNFNVHTVGDEIRIGQPNLPSIMEHDEINRWLWAGQSASFNIEDFRSEPTAARATFEINSERPLSIDVAVAGARPRTIKLSHAGKGIQSYSVPVQKGDTSITFKTDAPLIDIGGGRMAAYYLRNLQII